jgi:DNA-binding MarR family transcriptional regulator
VTTPLRGSIRAQQLGRLHLAGRELSAAAVQFHAALAGWQGVNATEEKVLDLIDRFGPLTATALSERAELAPASVTGLIDRLARKGFVRRMPHPHDGRSVLIEPVEDRLAELGPLYADWVASLAELCEEYTEQELDVIIDFLAGAAGRQRTAAERVTQAAERRRDSRR